MNKKSIEEELKFERVNIRIPKSVKAAYVELAREVNATTSSYMSMILRMYLDSLNTIEDSTDLNKGVEKL